MAEAQSSLGGARIIAPEVVKRELRRAFLGFFALCLAVPLLQTLYPIMRLVDPVEERRSASPFPPLRSIPGEDGAFCRRTQQMV
jgi:hypothetical protein